MEKNSRTLPTSNILKTIRVGYFKNIASAYQQCMLKFQTHEEDSSLMNAFQPSDRVLAAPDKTRAYKIISAIESLLL